MAEEQVIIVDENNNEVEVVPRSEMRKNNLRYRSTFIFVFNSKGEILVTKRTETKDVYPGLYEIFHGGTVAYGETFEQNAYKEIEEELGIKNIDLEFLFKFSYKDKVQNCIGKVYKCVYDGEIKIQEEEVESYFFVSVKKLKEMIKEDSGKFTGDGLYVFKKYLEEYHD